MHGHNTTILLFGGSMDILNVSITEGKKDFTKIIRASEEKKQKIIVSRRGNPVAIILPYEEYSKSRKIDALQKIKEARAIYQRSGTRRTCG